MRPSSFILILSVILGSTSLGCVRARPCAEGQRRECACPGGVRSHQVCRADRTGWEACDCPDAGQLTEGSDRGEAARGPDDPGVLYTDARFKVWLGTRVKNAKAGKREVVRIPIVKRGKACDCPDFFVGDDPMGDPAVWVNIRPGPYAVIPDEEAEAAEAPPGKAPAKVEENDGAGYILFAEGSFTGKTTAFEWPEGEESHPVWDFEIIRSRELKKTQMNAVRFKVLLDGEEATRELEPFADEGQWLAIASLVPLFEKNGAERAERTLEKLHSAGFTKAEVFDSRRAPMLYCCHHVVVAGRYPTRIEAWNQVKAMRSKAGLTGFVRQGFKAPPAAAEGDGGAVAEPAEGKAPAPPTAKAAPKAGAKAPRPPTVKVKLGQ